MSAGELVTDILADQGGKSTKAKGRGKGKTHGLYRTGKPVSQLDGRSKEYREWKAYITAFKADLGELSFGQMMLCELSFWKVKALSEFVAWIFSSKKERSILTLVANEALNRSWNCMSNSLRGDLRDIYGPKGLKRVEQKLPSLEQYLKAKEAEQDPLQEENKNDDSSEK